MPTPWLRQWPALCLALITAHCLMLPAGASAQSDTRAEDALISPFSINISDTAIADLRQRLHNRRLPAPLADSSWDYGIDLAYLDELLDYWGSDFNWREQEASLNSFDQFTTEIDGLELHFIHQRSPHPDAMPLLLTHGWPGSIAEFRELIGPLTEPERFGGKASDAFHVIAPSLPGFGFSGKPQQRGYSPERMAHTLATLMQRLDYERYAVQGGDWGAIINRILTHHYSERVIGLHSNFVLAAVPDDPAVRDAASAEDLARRAQRQAFMANETAYQQIQGTKPHSVGVGLDDSPAGLAAWIIEKFHGWSDVDHSDPRGLDARFSRDALLTNVSIYWFTQSATSSARIYYENRQHPVAPDYITVPVAAAQFPAEIYYTPRAWAEASYNIVRWSEMPSGGHFAAMEEPALLLEDVRQFFRGLRRAD